MQVGAQAVLYPGPMQVLSPVQQQQQFSNGPAPTWASQPPVSQLQHQLQHQLPARQLGQLPPAFTMGTGLQDPPMQTGGMQASHGGHDQLYSSAPTLFAQQPPKLGGGPAQTRMHGTPTHSGGCLFSSMFKNTCLQAKSQTSLQPDCLCSSDCTPGSLSGRLCPSHSTQCLTACAHLITRLNQCLPACVQLI